MARNSMDALSSSTKPNLWLPGKIEGGVVADIGEAAVADMVAVIEEVAVVLEADLEEEEEMTAVDAADLTVAEEAETTVEDEIGKIF